MVRPQRCPCGSRRLYANCCKRFLETDPCAGLDPKDTFLQSWVEIYGPVTAKGFGRRARPHVFRVSCLLQSFVDRYMAPPTARTEKGWVAIDEPIRWIEHNTLLSIFGSLALLQQGLFIQSGVLLRCVLENCFVLVDLHENEDQMELLMKDRYSVNKVVNRTKRHLPNCVREWYGYFSRNFAHFGPLHPAPFIPTKCWGDNWALVVGLQNIVRACAAFGIVMEWLHFDGSTPLIFWKQDPEPLSLSFDDNAPVWGWIDQLGQELVASCPPGERKEGFFYSEKGYRLKCVKPSRDED